jgi:hypothetical protein
MMPKSLRWLDAGALGSFIALTLWLTWPLGARLTTGLSHSPDSLLNAWALGWSFHVLPEDPFALFQANIFAPRPDTLAYSEHLFGVVVLVWPVFLATGNLVLAYNTAYFLSFVLSGFGMYLLVRELTSNRWAALLAGTIYLAAPYRFGHLLQLQLLQLQWFPFVYLFVLRFLREGRGRDLAGVILFSVLQILSCNYYALYLALALALFALVFLRSWRKALPLVGGAAVVAVLTLPFLLPYQRNRERGFYRRYEDVVHFSASFSDYFTPSAFNRPPYRDWLKTSERSEKALFLGFGAMGLAGVGVYLGVSGERRRPAIYFAVLTSVAVVLSLGPELRLGGETFLLPYRFFYRFVPGFPGLRVPARVSVLALLGISALAGLGAASALSKLKRFEKAAGLALLGALLVEYRTYPLDRIFPDAPEIPAVHQWIASAPPGTVLVLPIYEGEEITNESLAMYHATAHFQPLVNGYSGWWPNDYWELVGRLRHFPTARSVRFLLERAPVRYIVVHYDRIPEPRRRELERGMERYREQMPVAYRMGNDVVYEVRGESVNDPS